MRIISFDMTGTLVTYRFCDAVWFEGLPQVYAQRKGVSLERAKEYLFNEYDRVGEGRVEWYDIKYWYQHFGLGNDWEALLDGLRDRREFYPEVHSVLESMSGQCDLVVVTNAAQEFVDIEMAEVRHYFKRIFSAVSDFQQVKKTADFYLQVCHALGVESGELVHVGDHWQFDYIVPQSLGIRAFYLDRQGQKQGPSIVPSLKELEKRLDSGG